MKIVFSCCLAGNTLTILFFVRAIIIYCLNGTVHTKAIDEIVTSLMKFTAIIWLTIGALILYINHCDRTATALAFLPFVNLVYAIRSRLQQSVRKI